MLIGYARVSTVQQNLDRQLAALRAAKCERVFAEKVSGATTRNRPSLEMAIDALGMGDVLVLAEWDRATRSMTDGIGIMQRVQARGAAIKVLDKPHLDLTTKRGQGILTFLSAIAEDERERIHKRAAEGRKTAKVRGVKLGRPLALDEFRTKCARERLQAGESCRQIAKEMNVHHSTISRVR